LDLLYGVWFWLLFLLIVPPVAILVGVTPGLRLRRSIARLGARILAAVTGMHLRVEGLQHFKSGKGPWIVASNHASYLDAFVLMALLPPEFGYVAKRELEGNAFARMFLRSLGTVFVERFDAGQGVEETRKVVEVVRSGGSVAIFPEGTFVRAPGLLPFRMGTFVMAAQTGAPVVPVVIRGSRSKLRDEEWLPRRGGIEVLVLPPVRAEGSDWGAAVRLREVVRAEILAHAGEPDLG
ncbi:MAG TPA: lysophospholipid acyltransferase family protein, partial [Thermoanaerobaculia bacterium]|nr:lysophospholipid acyltransferase family protein [Thermoanaerobaculia bacterium]